MSDTILGCDDDIRYDKIKETVCINAPRIYDSCSDKDCLEDLPVLLTKAGQALIDKATGVRLNNVSVCSAAVSLQPVPFHNGFYAVDMTFYFDVCMDAFMSPNALPIPVKGLAVFSKRAVLFGSEGNVKIYTSECPDAPEGVGTASRNCPKAVVQVAEPIALSARLSDRCSCSNITQFRIPEAVMRRYGGEFVRSEADKEVLVSIGMFTIVQLERNVQMMIPAYDFCLPKKECISSSEDPCELFSSIEFPTTEFFPKDCPDKSSGKFGCGCSER